MTNLIETANKEWGFYGTIRLNFNLSHKNTAIIYDQAVRLLSKLAKYNDLKYAVEYLDSRDGRHHANDVGNQTNAKRRDIPSIKAGVSVLFSKPIYLKYFTKFTGEKAINKPLETSSPYFNNTDTVDIENKQIGIHCLNSGLENRELTIGVKHLGTKESVEKAEKLANQIVKFLNSRKGD